MAATDKNIPFDIAYAIEHDKSAIVQTAKFCEELVNFLHRNGYKLTIEDNSIVVDYGQYSMIVFTETEEQADETV